MSNRTRQESILLEELLTKPTAEPVSTDATDNVVPLDHIQLHQLASGRRVEVGLDRELIRIYNPQGQVELSVQCGAQGCVLQFESANVALQSKGKLDIQCDELNIDAANKISLNTRGDMINRVAGNSTTNVAGKSSTEADELRLKSTRGDVLIEANDFLRLNGEEILLNSEDDPHQKQLQLEAFWKAIGF